MLAAIEGLVGHPLDLGFEEWRASDQRCYVPDTRRAAADLGLGLGAPLPWHRGLTRLAEWLAERRGLHLRPQAGPAAATRERRFGSSIGPATTAWRLSGHAPAT